MNLEKHRIRTDARAQFALRVIQLANAEGITLPSAFNRVQAADRGAPFHTVKTFQNWMSGQKTGKYDLLQSDINGDSYAETAFPNENALLFAEIATYRKGAYVFSSTTPDSGPYHRADQTSTIRGSDSPGDLPKREAELFVYRLKAAIADDVRNHIAMWFFDTVIRAADVTTLRTSPTLAAVTIAKLAEREAFIRTFRERVEEGQLDELLYHLADLTA